MSNTWNIRVHLIPLATDSKLEQFHRQISYVRGIACFGTIETVGKKNGYGGYALRKRYVFNSCLKDESEVTVQTSSGRSFQIVGASKLKLLQNCFGDL